MFIVLAQYLNFDPELYISVPYGWDPTIIPQQRGGNRRQGRLANLVPPYLFPVELVNVLTLLHNASSVLIARAVIAVLPLNDPEPQRRSDKVHGAALPLE